MSTAKHQYGWKRGEAVVFIGFTVGAAALITSGLTGGFDLKGSIVLSALLLITGWGTTYYAATRKAASALRANMSTKDWEATFWMKKPNKAIWGSKLDFSRNTGKLDTVTKISLLEIQTVPLNKVIVFTIGKDGKQIYLPYRLAYKPAVRDFLLALVEHLNGKVPADSLETMNEFAGILNHNRVLEAAEESEDVEKPVAPTAEEQAK